jgi:transcriptional regulator with XRE-family HTH domain
MEKTRIAGIDRQIGARVRSLRTMMGLTQREFAYMLGCSEQQVGKYEEGVGRLSAGRLFEVAQILGVRIEDLFENLPSPDAATAEVPAPPSTGAVRRLNERHLQALLYLARASAIIH